MRFARGLWRLFEGSLDGLEGVAAVSALVLVILSLASGRAPKNLEQVGYALLGALLIIAGLMALWVWRKSRRQTND